MPQSSIVAVKSWWLVVSRLFVPQLRGVFWWDLLEVSSDLDDHLAFMMVSWQENPRCGVSCHGFGTILTSSCWYCSQLTHGVWGAQISWPMDFGWFWYAQGLLDVLRSGMAIIILWMGQGEDKKLHRKFCSKSLSPEIPRGQQPRVCCRK